MTGFFQEWRVFFGNPRETVRWGWELGCGIVPRRFILILGSFSPGALGFLVKKA